MSHPGSRSVELSNALEGKRRPLTLSSLSGTGTQRCLNSFAYMLPSIWWCPQALPWTCRRPDMCGGRKAKACLERNLLGSGFWRSPCRWGGILATPCDGKCLRREALRSIRSEAVSSSHGACSLLSEEHLHHASGGLRLPNCRKALRGLRCLCKWTSGTAAGLHVFLPSSAFR